jgi:hypothetical protein
MNWIVFLFAVEAGFMPMSHWTEYPQAHFENRAGSLYTELETEIQLFWIAFVGGRVVTSMLPSEDTYMFNSLTATYAFSAGFRIGQLEAGFRHVCGPHPVDSFRSEWYDEAFEGAYEQVYLRVEGRTQ